MVELITVETSFEHKTTSDEKKQPLEQYHSAVRKLCLCEEIWQEGFTKLFFLKFYIHHISSSFYSVMITDSLETYANGNELIFLCIILFSRTLCIY